MALRRRGRGGWTLLLLVGLLANGPARAADPIQFPAINFKPVASPLGYLQTESAWTLPHLSPAVRLVMNYARTPLQVYDRTADKQVSRPVVFRVNGDLTLAMGFWDRLELGVAIPVTMSQGGDDLQGLDREPGSTVSAGMGDIRITPKVRIVTAGPATFGLATPLSVPSGSRDNFIGDGGVTFAPRLAFSINTTYFNMAINGGYNIRGDKSFYFTDSQQQVTVDDEVFGSLGMRIALWRGKLELMVDGWVATSVFEQDKEEVPAELLAGLRGTLPHGITIEAGGGAGLNAGLGTPRYRIFWGVGYQYSPPGSSRMGAAAGDRDGDGLVGDEDACPDKAEDMDGYQDADGCPELDNDLDGIPDGQDRCPLDPEDRDMKDDEDGCPDVDNDGDRVPDIKDRCPNRKEDIDGFQDQDGCPDLDNDDDGYMDVADRCPDRPEDRDGVKDGDGCPDPDNDNDGLLDTMDKCPLQAEDPDGFQDQDGCPDADNDGDGIADDLDQCPNRREVFNNLKDEDGCPDQTRGPVNVAGGKITVPTIRFATGRDRLLPWSRGPLKKVARLMIFNPWIKRVQVEGHTDSRGSAKRNLVLSRKRAVRVKAFLVKQGVEAGRLGSEGFGEGRPVASNKNARGRAKNRRVEILIVDPVMSPR